MSARYSPQRAKDLLHGGGECAMLDVREAAAHGDGHPLFAAPCPYSRLETTVDMLVPRRSVPIVIVDDGDGLGHRAAMRLEAMGYADVGILEGGAPGWAAAGFRLFSGVNVPSKVLGELVEHELRPDAITAGTLRQWAEAGRNFLLFDVRPPSEYAGMTVPGALNFPNGELAHRIGAAIFDREVPIVVTCAGRTRGFIGAAGLRMAGVSNPVFALENGTQGWTLAGYELQRDNSPAPLPRLSEPQREGSRERARALMAAQDIVGVSVGEVARFTEDNSQTTYLFDVRTAEERSSNPFASARAVSGVQLVQATDHFIGVRRAVVVVIDDTGLRAALSAAFLKRMGFDTRVLALDTQPKGHPALAGGARWRIPRAPRISISAAVDRHAAGRAAILDLRPSSVHAKSRPEGAIWTMRPDIPAQVSSIVDAVLLFTDDADLADLVAIDLVECGVAAEVVDGGLADWREAGGKVDDQVLRRDAQTAPDQVWFTHGRHDGDRQASLQYLAWELNLLADLDSQERLEFRA